VRYAVSPDEIQVDARPTDCDFIHAPLGSKGCHYEAVVYDARGKLDKSVPSMRRWIVKGPDGKEYKIEADSQEDAIRRAQGRAAAGKYPGDEEVDDAVKRATTSVYVGWVKKTD
jgi:hypothetical protein